MNKKHLSLSRLSLAKQLILILAVLGIVIVLLVIPLIEHNMRRIVGNQMIDTIASQQQSLMLLSESNLADGSDLYDNLRQQKQETNVNHFIYFPDKNVFRNLTSLSNDNALALQRTVFNPYLVNQIRNGEIQGTYHAAYNDLDVYFVITESEKANAYWISFAYSDISGELLNDLRNELVYLLYGVILCIALVLSLWVFTLIKPLKDIQCYISAIKKKQPRQLNVSRQDEIGQVSLALLEMESELERQDQLKSDLIHNISHDLKTPIAIIRTYSESMKEDIYPYGDKNSSLDIIIENADRLEKKVKDFLYLNRLDYIEAKKQTYERIDLTGEVEHLVELLSPLHPQIKLETEIEEGIFTGDIEHWHSAVLNILDNATRYATSEIKIILRTDYLEIYNDGSHIDDSLMRDLFKPYTKGPKGNFGLGMSIVYKVVTMYGYEIEAKNQSEGVSFIIQKKKSV